MDLRNGSMASIELLNCNKTPVTSETGESVAQKINAVKYLECSALTRQGVNDVFGEAIQSALGAPGNHGVPNLCGCCSIF